MDGVTGWLARVIMQTGGPLLLITHSLDNWIVQFYLEVYAAIPVSPLIRLFDSLRKRGGFFRRIIPTSKPDRAYPIALATYLVLTATRMNLRYVQHLRRYLLDSHAFHVTPFML